MLSLWCLALLVAPTFGGPSSRIIHGKPAIKNQFPYMGYLDSEDEDCGCALISKRHCVTAAHCIDSGAPWTSYKVKLGTIDLKSDEGQTLNVSTGYLYNASEPGCEYVDDIPPCDIGVVVLSEDANLELDGIGTIERVTSWKNSERHTGTIVGYGETETGDEARFLRYAEIKIFDRDTCNVKYGGNFNFGHMCVQDENNKKTACHGDSGGPLIYDNKLVAVASALDQDDCPADEPVIYTSVKHYEDFINEILRKPVN